MKIIGHNKGRQRYGEKGSGGDGSLRGGVDSSNVSQMMTGHKTMKSSKLNHFDDLYQQRRVNFLYPIDVEDGVEEPGRMADARAKSTQKGTRLLKAAQKASHGTPLALGGKALGDAVQMTPGGLKADPLKAPNFAEEIKGKQIKYNLQQKSSKPQSYQYLKNFEVFLKGTL